MPYHNELYPETPFKQKRLRCIENYCKKQRQANCKGHCLVHHYSLYPGVMVLKSCVKKGCLKRARGGKCGEHCHAHYSKLNQR